MNTRSLRIFAGWMISIPGLIVAFFATVHFAGRAIDHFIVTVTHGQHAWQSGLRVMKQNVFSNGEPLPPWAYIRIPIIFVLLVLVLLAMLLLGQWVAGEDILGLRDPSARRRIGGVTARTPHRE
jgi:hypothetical protein